MQDFKVWKKYRMFLIALCWPADSKDYFRSLHISGLHYDYMNEL